MNEQQEKLARVIYGDEVWNQYLEYCEAKHDIEEEPLDIDSFLDLNKQFAD